MCDAFNRNRVELWQRALQPGDCFCIVARDGVVIYGVVMPPAELAPLEWFARRAMTFAEAFPRGSDDLVDIRQMDLPLTRAQFVLAEELGWPGDRVLFGQIARLGPPAAA